MKDGKQIPKGYKPSPLGPIPNDWDIKKIGDIADLRGGYAFDSSRFEESGKYQVVKMSNLYDHNLNLERSNSFLNDLTQQEKEFLLSDGDILITLTGTVGKKDYGYSYQINGEKNLLLNQRVAKIAARKVFDHRYLYHAIKTTAFLNQFFLSARGGTGNQANVGTVDLATLKVLSPPLNEQTAIANLLGTWDKAINTLTQLITQKEERKKWLMQHLLTGKKRLKGFKGEWREFQVGEVFDFISTSSFSRDCLTLNNTEGNIYCVHYGDIHSTYENDYIRVGMDQIPLLKTIYNNDVSEFLKEGDLILADASEDYEGVGESVELVRIGKSKVIGGLHTIVLRNKKNDFTCIGFKGHLFNNSEILNSLRRVATGTSVYSISKSTLSCVKIKLPTIEEQRAITVVLDRADEELNIHKEKLSTLVQQKKGLMQALLTGKKRLK